MSDQNVETRTLRYFVAVVENLHFSKAADRLGISQSVLSVAIQKLEAQLGVKLLLRNKRQPVSLTDAGKTFHAHALIALQHIDQAIQIGMQAARGLAGVVKAGFVGSAVTTGAIQGVLRSYRAEHPAVRVEILPMETPAQLEGLKNGAIDVGILRARREYPKGVDAIVLQSERLAVAMADNHLLCLKDELSPADLARESFIIPQFDESEGFSEILADLGRAGGFAGQPHQRVKDFMSAIALAAGGYGVVLAPESIIRLSPPGVTYRQITGFDRRVDLALAFRTRGNSPAVLALIDKVRAAGQAA
ncbi:LysR family transcriptional regulator [Bordetella hinzii]|nr:LysR family transcriptional regulator [Bordetella hinzii]AKQ61626.1 HTH-type transcriptional regulator BenM [Bordetella hinzii]KCB22253.1 LysR substrate-binding domain protein [Bordetella hinzii OH87 BAL007II]KCB33613.1 LysR substrate-binding domain protein [Bordetella hinzii CA90 BAL1384]KCB40740.1 LysR substrate-binding domain protein [Bordetella hinzii 5132]KCB46522.1 LysR substrate-binding domain protein [Bordetella hinzii 4161]